MGRNRGLYEAEFPAGTLVRVAGIEALQTFQASWRWHHPLVPEQLRFAGQQARVTEVSYYHGGDELYVLEGLPGIWHEQGLLPVGSEGM